MKRSTHSQSAPAQPRCVIQSLESRQLFSAGVSGGSGVESLMSLTRQFQQNGASGTHVRAQIKIVGRVNKLAPQTASGPVAYTPAQIRHAYGFDQVSANGAGQTIAIVDAYNDPHIATDLNTFDNQWGLPAASLTSVAMKSNAQTNAGWGMETALDIEWAHAAAPGAKLLLVQAASTSTTDLLAAVDYASRQAGVSVVSMSWGGGEFYGEWTLDSHFTTSKVTFVASAGDTGGAQSWPAESPNVVSVGGTSLPLDSSGNRIGSETAWSGSGGGYSHYEAEPSYQTSMQRSGARGNPDVAYDADGNTGFYVYDSNYNGTAGWYDVGGTSAGAPQWASLIAVADQLRASAGKAPLSGAQQTLPALYSTSTAPSSSFHDIVTGAAGSYSAGTGYDLVTGRGSPFANKIIGELAGF